MCRVGICVESFMCAGILLLQWQGENFAHRQNLKFWQFQHVHCTLWLQKSYISKSIQPIFEILAQIEDVEGAHLGGKFHVRGYFTFAMARWKVCALKTFEILPISTCTLCQENPISPKVFNRFSKYLPQLEDVEGGHLGGKFYVCRYFNFAMARRKLRASTTFEILPLSNCTLRYQKFYTYKDIQPIFEIFAWAWRCWWWPFGWKVSGAQVLCFEIARRKLCASTTFEILQLSTCSLWQQKSYISKGVQTIFEILASARRCLGWAFAWNVSGAQVFYFCNGKVKTLRIDKIRNSAAFNLYTVHCGCKNPISPKVFNRFSKALPSSEMLRVGIWV